MKNVKTLRGFYQKAKQNELVLISSRVVRRAIDNPAYDPVRKTLDVLEPLNEKYQISLENALDGSTAEVALKDQLKIKIVDAMDDLADLLDIHSGGDPLYMLNLGLKVQEGGSAREGDPDAPANFLMESTLTPGQVLALYEILQPTIVTGVAFEWSADGGKEWQNGTQTTSKSRCTLTGLPSRTEVLVRCYCVATRNRKSIYSAELSVFVF